MKRTMVSLVIFTAAVNAFAYYNPGQGRWTNRDPMEEVDGPNVYAFVNNNAVSLVDVLGLYQFGGLQTFYGINSPRSPIGGKVFGATGGRLEIVKLKTELKDCDKKCCLKELDTKLTIKVFLPNIGDQLTGHAGFSDYTFIVNAEQQANIREHEQLHVNAHFRITGALCPKMEKDCIGKCETRWFGRQWTATSCEQWWRNKIEGELDWIKGKMYKAAGTLDTWTQYFNENVSLGQEFTSNYEKYVAGELAGWSTHKFCD